MCITTRTSSKTLVGHNDEPPRSSGTQPPQNPPHLNVAGYITIKVIYFALLIAMYFGLSQAYTEFWQPLFSYTGFIQSYVPTREIEALSMLFIAAVLMPVRFQRPSDVYVPLAILTTLLPTAMMYAIGNIKPETAYLTLFGIFLICLSREVPIPVPRLQWIDGFDPIPYLTLLAATGVLLTVQSIGTKDFSFALFDVYSRRQVASDAISGAPAYIVSFGLMANSLAIILSLYTRQWIMLSINLISAILYFGLIGHKAPLFTLPIIAALNYTLRKKHILLFIFAIFTAFIVLAPVLYQDQSLMFTINGEPSGFFDFASTYERRGLILPAWVNDAYVRYFTDHEKLHWAYSRLSFGLVDQTLPFDPPDTIGYYLDEAGMYANTGFIGSGYMNAGSVGVLAYAVVIGLCCQIIDSFARRNDTKILSTLICLPGFMTAVTSAELPTALLTHGWAATIVLVGILRYNTRRI